MILILDSSSNVIYKEKLMTTKDIFYENEQMAFNFYFTSNFIQISRDAL